MIDIVRETYLNCPCREFSLVLSTRFRKLVLHGTNSIRCVSSDYESKLVNSGSSVLECPLVDDMHNFGQGLC
jgi:hypothetical protein